MLIIEQKKLEKDYRKELVPYKMC